MRLIGCFILFLAILNFNINFINAQNRITPPGQVKTPKKEKETTVKSNKPSSKKTSTNKPAASNIETINGITVKWNGATPKQKAAITELLKNMVFVEGGDFVMGSTQLGANEKEIPPHLVSVNSFWIDKYEVTKGLWDAIMEDNYELSFTVYYGFNISDTSVIRIKDNNYPIIIHSYDEDWEKLLKFINKLNTLTGLNFGLPTEAEWEYAARGGKFSQGYKYSGSSNLDDVAWHDGNSNHLIHPVGTKQPNELGLYDMSGNVMEWTSDLYRDDYNSSPEEDEYINTSRGGYYWRSDCHVTVRYYGDVDGGMVGVRLILKTNVSSPNTNDFHDFNYGLKDQVKEEQIKLIPIDKTIVQKDAPIGEVMRRDIFFKTNSSIVREQEMNKIADLVQYLYNHSNTIITITGYEDKGTGSISDIQRLAAQRAQSVANLLNRYDIPEDRIIVKTMGDDMYMPYPDIEQNRVAICIAEAK